MKKFMTYLGLLSALWMISPVYAKENKLYFTESGDYIYYDSKLLDENVFMNHTDMVPGESYIDELTIENGTDTDYTLYFKVIPKEQSAEAEELLENIEMKITMDGYQVYEGKVTGTSEGNQGLDLQQRILLGEVTKEKSIKMVVETKLLESYSVPVDNEISYIDWAFYARYGEEEKQNEPEETPKEDETKEEKEPIEIIPSSDTMRNNSISLTIILSGIIVITGLGIVGYAYKRKD